MKTADVCLADTEEALSKLQQWLVIDSEIVENKKSLWIPSVSFPALKIQINY